MNPDANPRTRVRFARPGSAVGGSSTRLDATTELLRKVASSTDCCKVSIRPSMDPRWATRSVHLLVLVLPAAES